MITPFDKKVRDIQHALLCLEADNPVAQDEAEHIMISLLMTKEDMVEFLTEHNRPLP
jgi:hypothetical protein